MADPGSFVLVLMGTAFFLSNAAELLPNGLARPRAVLRGAGFAAYLLLMVSLVAWLVAIFVTGSVRPA